jgi:hypothetical protein
MCHCNHYQVSNDLTHNGIVDQTCKDCGKTTQLPGTMSAVIKYMRQKPSKYRHALNMVETYHSKVM